MFIAAGLHTITKYVVDNFGDQSSFVLSKLCPNGLISFGINLDKKSKKKFDKKKYIQTTVKQFKKEILPVKENTYWMLDSGGYQASTGFLRYEDIPQYLESYIEFVTNYPDYYNEAFTLDMPVTNLLYDNMDQVYEENYNSYKEFTKLPEDIRREKILFVSHFRTLNNFNVWNKLIFEDRLADYFDKFSIGGLVVGMQSLHKLPINLYTIGALQIALYLKEYRDKSKIYRFHILGASNHKSVLFFYLLQEAIEYFLHIKFDISYDSSNIFKKLLKARSFTYFDEHSEISKDISLKYKNLDKIDNTFHLTNREIFLKEVSAMKRIIGIDTDTTNQVYESENGTFHPDVHIYAILLEAYEQLKFDNWARQKAKELFEIFKQEKYEEFQTQLDQTMIRIHKGGKVSKAILDRSKIYTNSLRSIENFNTIEDLIGFMYNYHHITDNEGLTDDTTWNDLLEV